MSLPFAPACSTPHHPTPRCTQLHHATSPRCNPPAVPKSSDPRMATFPCMDNPFVHQLCKCLRTGKSTATLHDLSK